MRRRGGWPGADLLDKAEGRPHGQPLWGSHCTASLLPQRKGRELGQLTGAAWARGTWFRFPLHPLVPA